MYYNNNNIVIYVAESGLNTPLISDQHEDHTIESHVRSNYCNFKINIFFRT